MEKEGIARSSLATHESFTTAIIFFLLSATDGRGNFAIGAKPDRIAAAGKICIPRARTHELIPT